MRKYDLSIGASYALALMVMHAPKAPAAPAAPKVETVEGYDFTEVAIPETARVGVGKTGEESKLAKALKLVPLDRSFLEPVKIADTITDAAEQKKAFAAEARKVTNRIGGAIRRLHKTQPEANFAMRTVNDPTGPLGVGVRVWRVKDSTAEELAEKAAKAAAAKAAKAATPPPPPAPAAS